MTSSKIFCPNIYPFNAQNEHCNYHVHRDYTHEKEIPYARDGRPLFSYNRSRFITAFMKVKEMKKVKFQYVISQPL